MYQMAQILPLSFLPFRDRAVRTRGMEVPATVMKALSKLMIEKGSRQTARTDHKRGKPCRAIWLTGLGPFLAMLRSNGKQCHPVATQYSRTARAAFTRSEDGAYPVSSVGSVYIRERY